MNQVQTSAPSTRSFELIGSEISQLLPSMSAIDDIALGWTDALLFGSKYISPKLKFHKSKGEKTSPRGCTDLPALDCCPAEQLLSELPVYGSVIELSKSVDRLNELPKAALLRDDYWDVAADQLQASISHSFVAGRFNLVIVGAGPVGVLLAASLKKALGEAVDILLVESRVAVAHQKRPYSRRWQTNIPLSLIEDMLHPIAASVCARTGNEGYIGVDICALESLALLSARIAGVRCLFVEHDALDWLAELPVHLLIDASGARWRKPEKSEEKIYPGLLLKKATSKAKSYVDCGLVRFSTIPNSRVDVKHKDGWLHPLYKGNVIRQSLIKVQDIPLACYQPLLQWIQKNNSDNKFYLWRCRKNAEINRLLMFVSLTEKEHKILSQFIGETEVDLINIIKWSGFKSSLDSRLQSLFRKIYDYKKSNCTALVSKPFLFEPRMLDPDVISETLHGIPVLPIGDSFFNGNPMTGNGLGVHLKHIRFVRHELMSSLSNR